MITDMYSFPPSSSLSHAPHGLTPWTLRGLANSNCIASSPVSWKWNWTLLSNYLPEIKPTSFSQVTASCRLSSLSPSFDSRPNNARKSDDPTPLRFIESNQYLFSFTEFKEKCPFR